ncbi:MAG: hypothetical protein DM484_04280 [Candidatus Methylumidiphilus alinenensis]|uniref:Uncharacterized protein n=1 Tax=Candidatus Methylumidiphilus alinenensis TaxID=2202197 RepID=A0A2W4T899_9GAMM|nr:MAG: hypothetical protein DM484_04280 [Candidatus Methylumidiphilus alinenensis]
MKLKLITLGLMISATLPCVARDLTVGNATELRTFLLTGRHALAIEPIPAQRGCGPGGCSIDLGSVSIVPNKGKLLDLTSNKTIKIRQQTSGTLPKLDWDPFGAYTVKYSGTQWGTCLEFTHAGLGKSGSFQRWISVILIPRQDSKPAPIAYRFIGYWASCDVIMEGRQPSEAILATLEPVAKASDQLQIIWHSCTSLGCTTTKDSRIVSKVPSSENGSLQIQRGKTQ